MSRADVDAFLAECDDVLDDWEGSTDSASWAADGSHEYDTGGEAYYYDGAWPPRITSTYAATAEQIPDGYLADAMVRAARSWAASVEAAFREAVNFDAEEVRLRAIAYDRETADAALRGARDLARTGIRSSEAVRRIADALAARGGDPSGPLVVDATPEPHRGIDAQRSPFGPRSHRR